MISILDKILESYLHDDNEFALQIDGGWGCGKTYYIKSRLEELKKEDYSWVYFSLSGASSLTELKERIILKIFTETDKNVIDTIAKQSSNFLSALGKNSGNLTINGMTFLINKYIESRQSNITSDFPKRLLIVLDDLERLNQDIDVRDLLSFISNDLLVGIQAKVVIISNEQEFAKKEEFKKYKEKTIYKTVKFQQNLSNIIASLCNESPNEILSNLLHEKESDSYDSHFYRCSQNGLSNINIRTIQRIFRNFNELTEQISESEDLGNELYRSLLLQIIFIEFETQEQKQLDYLQKLEKRSYEELPQETRAILSKYYYLYEECFFIHPAIIYYLQHGYHEDEESIKDYIYDWYEHQERRTNPQKDSYEALWGYRDFNDKEIKEYQCSLVSEIKSSKLAFDKLLAAYYLLFSLDEDELNLAEYSLAELESVIVDRYSSGKEEGFSLDSFTWDRNSSLYHKLLEQKEERQFQLDIKRLRNIFEGNKEELQDYRSLSDGEDLFKVLNTHDLFEKYINSSPSKCHKLTEYLQAHYNMSNLKEYYKGDSAELDTFLQKLKECLRENPNLQKIDQFKIRELLDEVGRIALMLQ